LSGLCSPSSCPKALLPSVFHFGRPSASCAGSWSPGNGLGVEQRYNALMFGSKPSSLLVYIPLFVTLCPPLCFWCCASLRLEFTPMFGSIPHLAILFLYKAPMDSLVYCGCHLAGFPSLGFFLTIWSFPHFSFYGRYTDGLLAQMAPRHFSILGLRRTRQLICPTTMGLELYILRPPG